MFSTATAFYIPLIAIILIYYKIMRAAKKRFKRDRDRRTISRCLDENTKAKVVKQLSTMPPTTPTAPMTAMLTPATPVEDEETPEMTPTKTYGLYNTGGLAPAENGHYGKGDRTEKYESTTANNSTSDDERTPMQMSENPTTTNNVETQFISEF